MGFNSGFKGLNMKSADGATSLRFITLYYITLPLIYIAL